MPVAGRRAKIMQRFLRRFASLAAALPIVLVAGPCGLKLHAQTIQIRLLNGKTGRPLVGKCVNVWVGSTQKWAVALPTDKGGVASLTLTRKDSEVDTQHQWKGCGPPGVANPVFRYESTIRINAGFVVCQPHKPDYSWLATMTFSTQRVLKSGIVSPNRCGKATAAPEPGEVILFVRPLTWWEKLKQ